MLSVAAVVAAALLWLGLLFGTGLYAERHPAAFAKHWRHVYALSLAVHCTSWTFYGTVTQAVRHGWWIDRAGFVVRSGRGRNRAGRLS